MTLKVKSLCRKHKAASQGLNVTKGPFEELAASLDNLKVEEWHKKVERAEQERGEALDIYMLKMDKGGLPFSWLFPEHIESFPCSSYLGRNLAWPGGINQGYFYH